MPDKLSNLPPPLSCRAVFTIKEVGIIANLSERGVYNKFEAGLLKWVRHDGKRLVEREELISYLDGQPWRIPMPKDFDPEAHRAEQDRVSDILNGFIDEDGNELVDAD